MAHAAILKRSWAKSLSRAWPVRPLAWAWLFAMTTLLLVTPAFHGPISGLERFQLQMVVLAVVLGRIVWAQKTGERNAGWVFWMIFLVLAAPMWVGIELAAADLLR